jgi:anti-sigma factor ChrR (cupin superfamily)
VPHPERLPWFADGKLDPAEAAVVASHVATCDDCRDEVEALCSMYRSLRTAAPSEHVSPEALVAYHQGRLNTDERRAIDDHVRACQACAADLGALERAHSAGRNGNVRRLIATAASVTLVAAAAWQYAVQREAPAVTHVVFAPAQRGAETSHRLVGSGPWVLEIWAPQRAAASYVARIQRSDAPESAVFEATVASSSDDGKVLVSVPGPLRPGHHVLSLRPSDGDGALVYARGFDVVRNP